MDPKIQKVIQEANADYKIMCAAKASTAMAFLKRDDWLAAKIRTAILNGQGSFKIYFADYALKADFNALNAALNESGLHTTIDCGTSITVWW